MEGVETEQNNENRERVEERVEERNQNENCGKKVEFGTK